MTLYSVQIGDRSTRVRISENTIVDREYSIEAWEYSGGYHNYSGMLGAAVVRAVEKLFGRRAFWFGGVDDRSHGQVFEALRPTRNNPHPGNTALTSSVRLDVEEVQ